MPVSPTATIYFSRVSTCNWKGRDSQYLRPFGMRKVVTAECHTWIYSVKEGRIVLNGILLDKGNVDVVRKQTAWIPQELALPLEWVKDMVQLPFGLKANRGTPFSETRLFACFEDLGLEQELYYKRVNEISGGQRQRMMIAVASMIGKPLTIVDEPTSALDSGSAEKVLSFFRRQTENGSAILTVSHDKRFANGCDRHIIMK